MLRRILLATFLGACLSTRSVPVSAAEFSAMLKRVPGDTNALIMVDAERLFASPIAQEKGWQKKHAVDAGLHLLLLPPGAKKLVRAMQFDLTSKAESSEITLVDAPKGPPLAKIADRHQGNVEKISNVEAVWLPQGAYGVKLAEEVYGFMFPANRQALSRWLRDRSGQVSTYLLQASTEMKAKGPQLVLALDLEDAVPVGDLEAKLKAMEAISSSQVNAAEIAKVIAALRGVKFSVLFDKQATGTLTVEFDREVAPLKAVGKALLLEALGRNGIAIDEIDDWTERIEGKQVSLSGPLSDSGLMRLSSLLELPTDLIDDPEEKTEADNPMLYATQAHYKAVQKLVDDLFAKKKQSFGQYAQWAEQYAKKIDRLPLLNVDEEMQVYSAQVAEILRQGALAFKGVGIRSNGRQSQVWTSNYVNYDYYGNRTYGTYNAGDQAKRAIRGEEVARGATDAASMQQLIDSASAEIRKKMVAKYKVEF